MTFTFNTGIPAANNNPSVDQPDMLINNVSTDGILAVDHISFNALNGGTHKQMHMPSFTNPAVINGGASDGSVIYSAAGSADATRAQSYFKNAFNVAFPVSLIKAYGIFDAAAATLNAINITAVRTSTGLFRLTMPANVVASTSFGVLVSIGNAALNPATSTEYSIINITTVDVSFRNSATNVLFNPTSFTILILQI